MKGHFKGGLWKKFNDTTVDPPDLYYQDTSIVTSVVWTAQISYVAYSLLTRLLFTLVSRWYIFYSPGKGP